MTLNELPLRWMDRASLSDENSFFLLLYNFGKRNDSNPTVRCTFAATYTTLVRGLSCVMKVRIINFDNKSYEKVLNVELKKI